MGKYDYPGLNWVKTNISGEYIECVLGTQQDGCYFTLLCMPTCYRRGQYRLLISIFPGEHYHAWGCFDSDDQPMRWYHSKDCALKEAEAIARVLWNDRYRLERMTLAFDGGALLDDIPHEGTAI